MFFYSVFQFSLKDYPEVDSNHNIRIYEEISKNINDGKRHFTETMKNTELKCRISYAFILMVSEIVLNIKLAKNLITWRIKYNIIFLLNI